MERKSRLLAGLAELCISADSVAREQLLAYLTELEKWNRAYNLTAVREPLEMVTRHLLDSLSIFPWLQGVSALDVGSGAGLPGIPLAIVAPRRHWALLDSNGKKTRFLRHVVRTLDLDNVQVVESRIEAYRPRQLPDCVTARALASTADLLAMLAPLCGPGGRILAMKGKLVAGDTASVTAPFNLLANERLTVPGLVAERNLMVIERR